jgi:ABC-type polysaccharide/polyol phosphate transport system ATPase subunit
MSSDPLPPADLLVRAENIGKCYAADLTAGRLLRYISPWPMKPRGGDFWAVRNVSFSMNTGSVLGIIGRNGSGKSTILQIVAGLLEPSEGHLEVCGQISALLELGAGFNPEFTGRENIFLSGSVHGQSRDKMERRFEDIVSFADIGPHLDQPVKTYSSGMFARLAFAVAIQVDPEILIVDEILSVGDLGFQAQCFRKIEQLREKGTSILFVSHDLNAIQMLCDRVILLDEGAVVAQGKPQEVTNRYISLLSQRGEVRRSKSPKGEITPSSRVAIRDVRFTNSKGEETIHPFSGERCRVRYRVVFSGDVERPVVTLQFKTMVGLVLSDLTSLFANKLLPPCRKGDELMVTFDFELNLCPGPFRVGVSVAEVLDEVPVSLYGNEALTIEVVSEKRAYGLAYLKSDVSIEPIKGSSISGRES